MFVGMIERPKPGRRGRRVLIVAVLIIAVAAAAWFWLGKGSVSSPFSNQSAEQGFDKGQHSTTDPNSIWVVVNKTHPLPEGYRPNDLVDVNVLTRKDKSAEELQLRDEAAKAVERMFKAAADDSQSLIIGSAFRSYGLQKFYYDNYVRESGQQAADLFSAQPGTSEHQTGLALDIGAANGRCYLEVCFKDTPEGQWLAANAYKYGFILRYQEGRENVTGYQSEPWHFRYVGTELAAEIQKTGQTLEEFFGV